MGWSLKIRETKKHGTQYKIWTSIADGWITEKWLSREEIIKFLFWNKLRDFAMKFIEDVMTFPNGYSDKDSFKRLIIDEEKQTKYYDFIIPAIKDEKILYGKFNEYLDKIGVKLDVNDGTWQVTNINKENKEYNIEALDKKIEESNKETDKIAKKYGVSYDVAVSIWNDMNKAYKKQRKNA